MREAKIILPLADVPVRVHGRLRLSLTSAFGGVTETEGTGAWRDAMGKVQIEPVRVYTVAMEPTVANDIHLDEIALTAGKAAKQAAVYVTHASGEVVIFDLLAEQD